MGSLRGKATWTAAAAVVVLLAAASPLRLAGGQPLAENTGKTTVLLYTLTRLVSNAPCMSLLPLFGPLLILHFRRERNEPAAKRAVTFLRLSRWPPLLLGMARACLLPDPEIVLASGSHLRVKQHCKGKVENLL